jgi:hypothetical protein
MTSTDDDSETVVEVVVRSTGLRKVVDRELSGWKQDIGACSLGALVSLRPCFVTQGPSSNDVQRVSVRHLSLAICLTIPRLAIIGSDSKSAL